MARVLADHDVLRLIGKCLISAHKDHVKANTYELGLGRKARFRNSDELVELQERQYLEVGPGETVDLTSDEIIDFRAETVNDILPGKALMGLLTSRTTLMREGISFAPTKIDPGFYGTLDWVFKNHDFRPILLPYKERLVNLLIFELEGGEKPDFEYGQRVTDHYQGSSGLQPSARKLPAQIPEGLIRRQSKKPEDASRRIREYGPPLSWVGEELETLGRNFHELSQKVEGFMPKIEHAISSRFNKTYAFIIGVGGLFVALLQFLQRSEYAWLPWLIGGLSVILLFVAVFWRSKEKS